MHLVLGSERIDLRERVLVVDRSGGAEPDRADLVWLQPLEVAMAIGVPFGADAGTADEVHGLAEAGAIAVGLADPDAGSLAAAADRGLVVAVPSTAAAGAAGLVADDRLLVLVHAAPSPDVPGIACLDLVGSGPAAWGRATVALAAGVRVVRTPEPRSLRRVAVVAEQIRRAGVRQEAS